MSKDRTAPPSPTAIELRRLAEARLARRRGAAPLYDVNADPGRLVHELQVQHVELEMQSEELQAAREEAEAALHRYTQVFDFGPIGYFVLDADATIGQVNFAGARLLAMPPWTLVGRRMALFVGSPERALFADFLARLTSSGFEGSETCELTLVQSDGTWRCEARVVGTVLEAPSKLLLLAVQDVTMAKLAQAALSNECRRKDELIRMLQDLSKQIEASGSTLAEPRPSPLEEDR